MTSQNGKPAVIYGGYAPERERQAVFNIALVAVVLWTLALATLFGWMLSWI